jgi:hypothetical protein
MGGFSIKIHAPGTDASAQNLSLREKNNRVKRVGSVRRDLGKSAEGNLDDGPSSSRAKPMLGFRPIFRRQAGLIFRQAQDNERGKQRGKNGLDNHPSIIARFGKRR